MKTRIYSALMLCIALSTTFAAPNPVVYTEPRVSEPTPVERVLKKLDDEAHDAELLARAYPAWAFPELHAFFVSRAASFRQAAAIVRLNLSA